MGGGVVRRMARMEGEGFVVWVESHGNDRLTT